MANCSVDKKCPVGTRHRRRRTWYAQLYYLILLFVVILFLCSIASQLRILLDLEDELAQDRSRLKELDKFTQYISCNESCTIKLEETSVDSRLNYHPIFVRCSSYHKEMEVNFSSTIGDFQSILAAEWNLQPKQIYLLSEGKPLADSSRILYSYLSPGASVEVNVRMYGGMDNDTSGDTQNDTQTQVPVKKKRGMRLMLEAASDFLNDDVVSIRKRARNGYTGRDREVLTDNTESLQSQPVPDVALTDNSASLQSPPDVAPSFPAVVLPPPSPPVASLVADPFSLSANQSPSISLSPTQEESREPVNPPSPVVQQSVRRSSRPRVQTVFFGDSQREPVVPVERWPRARVLEMGPRLGINVMDTTESYQTLKDKVKKRYDKVHSHNKDLIGRLQAPQTAFEMYQSKLPWLQPKHVVSITVEDQEWDDDMDSSYTGLGSCTACGIDGHNCDPVYKCSCDHCKGWIHTEHPQCSDEHIKYGRMCSLCAEHLGFVEHMFKLVLCTRKFEIANYMNGITECPCCEQKWFEDFDDIADSHWKVDKEAFICHCATCKGKCMLQGPTPSHPTRESVKVCRTCHKGLLEVKKRNYAEGPKFGKSNIFYHADAAPVLKDLTYAEEQLIAMISPIMKCTKLKGGARVLSGHVACVEHDNIEAFTVLPRIPTDVQDVVFKRSSSYNRTNDYKVRRGKVSAALAFLKRYSPGYRAVEISRANLSNLPVDGFIELSPDFSVATGGDDDSVYHRVTGFTNTAMEATSEVQDTNEMQEETVVVTEGQNQQQSPDRTLTDLGPAPQQNENYVSYSGTVIPGSAAALDAHASAEQDLRRLIDVNETPAVRTNLRRNLVQWLKEPYFFSKAFPTLFVPDLTRPLPGGACEIPSDFNIISNRFRQDVKAHEFIEWLYKCRDSRFARHATLKFTLLNNRQREAMLKQTSFAVKQQLEQAILTVDELKNDFCAGRIAFGNKLVVYARNIAGTSAYWSKQRSQVSSMVQHKVHVNEGLPAFFHSGSFAEFHWQPWHNLLDEYLISTGQPSIRLHSSQPFSDQNVDKSKLTKALLENVHAANWFFVSRTKKWFELVLKEGLGVVDYFLRFEFAKSRGFIHYHSLLWSDFGNRFHEILDGALECTTMGELEEKEKEVSMDMESALYSHMGYTAMHPAGLKPKDCSCFKHRSDADEGEEFYNEPTLTLETDSHTTFVREQLEKPGGPDFPIDGFPAGNILGWHHPEGLMLGEEPPQGQAGETIQYNPFALNCFELSNKDSTLVKDVTNITNKTMMHECSAYCLRAKRVGNTTRTKLVCRFHYGDHCPESRVNTKGKPPSSAPYLVHQKDLSRLELKRDHPRLHPFSPILLQAYRGNFDISPVVAASKFPKPISELVNNYNGNDEIGYVREVCKVRKARGYMDRDVTTQTLIDYVVSYACKGEISHDEALDLYKNAIETAPEDSSLNSIAARTGQAILKARTIPSPEADFQNSGLRYVDYSVTPEWFWVNAMRSVNLNSLGAAQVKQNKWDEFLKRVDTDLSFYKYAMSLQYGKKKFPVFAQNYQQLRLPLAEEFCSKMLCIYKPYIQSFEDRLVRLNYLKVHRPVNPDVTQQTIPETERHPNAVDALQDFLQSDECPRGLQNAMNRARDKELVRNYLQQNAPTADGIIDDFSIPEISHTPDSIDEFLQNDQFENEEDDGFADMNMSDLNTSVNRIDYPWEEGTNAANVSDSGSYPTIDEMKARWAEACAEYSQDQTDLKLGDKNPVDAFDNDDQRYLLAKVIHHLKLWYEYKNRGDRDVEKPHPLRLVVQGVAGVGKSFCINNIAMMAKMLFNNEEASLVGTPTGCAAFNAGGVTLHSLFNLGVDKNKNFIDPTAQELISLQQKFENGVVLQIDEYSMIGKNLMGKVEQRCKNAFPCAEGTCFGSIPIVILYGDWAQLPPVGDCSLFTVHDPTEGAECAVSKSGGYTYKKKFNDALVMEKSVRQNDAEMLKQLGRLRNGYRNQAMVIEGMNYWNRRYLEHTPEEKAEFLQKLTVHCYATNSQVDACNLEYLQSFDDVCCVDAYYAGTPRDHVKTKKGRGLGSAATVPRRFVAAVDSVVKLTANLENPWGPKAGLYNGAMGKIVDILYEEGNSPSSDGDKRIPGVVLVSFPHYCGPALFPNSPKVVPIFPITRDCKSHCCQRMNIPLLAQKAKTAHGFQGATVGDTKMVQNIFIDPGTSVTEARWPNLLYVMASRASSPLNLAFHRKLDGTLLSKVGKSKACVSQRHEIKRLKELQKKCIRAQREQQLNNREKFIFLLNWFCDTIEHSSCTCPQILARCQDIRTKLDNIET